MINRKKVLYHAALPKAEDNEALKNDYMTRLQKMIAGLNKTEVEYIFELLERGQSLESVEAMAQGHMAEIVNQEYLDLAAINRAKCAHEGYNRGYNMLERLKDDEYFSELKDVHKGDRGEIEPPTKVKRLTLEEFVHEEAVISILATKQNYCGDFYSVYFSPGDDDYFFQMVADLHLAGYSPAFIVNAIDEEGRFDGRVTPPRIENVVRTEVATAVSEGKNAAFELDPDVVGYVYQCVEDDRTTEECRQRNGLFFSKESGLLAQNTPPMHYMCRCFVEPCTERSLKREHIAEERIAQDEGKLANIPAFKWHRRAKL